MIAGGGVIALRVPTEKSPESLVSSETAHERHGVIVSHSSAAAALTGRIGDDRGRPVAFATVRMSSKPVSTDVNARRSSPGEKQAQSDVNGAFRLDGIPVGRHRLRVEAEGFEDFESDPIVHRAPEDSAKEYELPPLMVQLKARREAPPRDRNQAGIGIVLEALTYELLVIDVLADGGAADAGMRVGDRIITVDDQPVSEIGAASSLERLTGNEGSTVEVEVVPKGAKLPETIRVERKGSLRDSLG